MTILWVVEFIFISLNAGLVYAFVHFSCLFCILSIRCDTTVDMRVEFWQV